MARVEAIAQYRNAYKAIVLYRLAEHRHLKSIWTVNLHGLVRGHVVASLLRFVMGLLQSQYARIAITPGRTVR
jgi:hypothetical protein